MELRSRVRYRLGTRVVFTWDDPNDTALKGVGITRDISLMGVFIFSSACPAVDATVQLNIFMPPFQKGAPGTRIAAEGTVLRVEHSLEDDDVGGFAVASNGFRMYGKRESDS